MREWKGTSRFVYNRVLDDVKKNDTNVNFFSLRNKHVIAKDNPIINKWETDTPKDIRAGVVNDMVKGYFTAITNLKRGNINHFKMRFRSRKRDSSTLTIPKSAIKITNGKLYIFPRYLGDNIKFSKDKQTKNLEIKHDSRIQYQNGKWFLLVPVDVKTESVSGREEACSSDPGFRNFQVIYGEKVVTKITPSKETVKKYKNKLDLFQSLRSKNTISRSKYNRKRNKLHFKMSNLTDELHNQTINYITKRYNHVIYPHFESQDMARKSDNKHLNRNITIFKHFKFKQRLINKCKVRRCTIDLCGEEYTSKTCGRCGSLNTIPDIETYRCKNCNLVIDRDFNGARNIMIKRVMETS